MIQLAHVLACVTLAASGGTASAQDAAPVATPDATAAAKPPAASGAPAKPPAASGAPATAAVSCQVAAPSCFGACGVGRVLTRNGLCVPQQPPPAAASLARPAAPETPVAAAAAPPTPAPGEPATPSPIAACCRVELSVNAVGIKNLGARANASDLAADLRINGQLVGRTPFDDAMPVGDYHVEVVTPGGQVRAQVVALQPGEPKVLRAAIELALDVDEQAARKAWREQRAVEAGRRRQAEETRRREEREAARQAAFQRELTAWEAETAPARSQRATSLPLGIVLAGGGAALLVAGVVFEVLAAEAHDEAASARSEWETTADQSRHPVLRREIDDAQARRDLDHAVGLTSLGLGLVATTVGVILLASMPSVREKPVLAGSAPLQLGLRVSPDHAIGELRIEL